MKQLYDSLRGHFQDLQDVLAGGDVGQFSAYEAEEFCTTAAELITLMEKNPEETGQILGNGHEAELKRLKECAVSVYKCIPYLNKIDEMLGDYSDEIYEVVDTYLDTLIDFNKGE